jgi:hypothetical protein
MYGNKTVFSMGTGLKKKARPEILDDLMSVGVNL